MRWTSSARIAWAIGCASSVAFASVAEAQSAPVAVQLALPTCAPSWFDDEAFARALSVELVDDGLRVDARGAVVLTVDVPCAEEDEPNVTFAIGADVETVSLVDLAPSVRMRVLALSTGDFVRRVLARAASPADAEQEPVTVVPAADPPRRLDALRLARPGVPEPVEAPSMRVSGTPSPERWLAVGLSARGLLLGLRVVAPSLSLEAEARVRGTPLVLWLAVDGLYAWGTDGLGEVRAFDLGGRVGARLMIDLAPVALSASLGLLVAYAHAEGAFPTSGARIGVIDGALVGLDGAVAASLAVSSDVRLVLSVGVLGYLVGFEARAEGRPVISFRDAAPWASLGVTIDLMP